MSQTVTESAALSPHVPAHVRPIDHPAMRAHRWQKGQSGNPLGKQGREDKLKEVRRLAKGCALASMQALIDIANNPDEDGRVRVVAIEKILLYGVGKPPEGPEHDPDRMTIDLTRLSGEQLAQLKAILASGALVPQPEPDESAPEAPQIEGEIASPEGQDP